MYNLEMRSFAPDVNTATNIVYRIMSGKDMHILYNRSPVIDGMIFHPITEIII